MAENNNNNNNNNANAVAEEAGATVPVEETKPSGGDVGATKNLDKALATAAVILSIPVLGFIVWIFYVGALDCEGLLRLPSFQVGIGIGLILLFVISNGVVFMRVKYPVLGLLIVMVPLLLTFVIGLALVGAYSMESRAVVASPKWLRLKVFDEARWADIKSCIFYTGACDDLNSRTLMLKSYDFSLRKLSSVESGCCTPATICEMEYVNATFWRKRGGDNNGRIRDSKDPYDSDCDLWDNEKGNLCYNCVSCKTGFVKSLQAKWRKLGVFLIVTSLLLFISHLILFLSSIFQQFRT